MGGQGAGGGRVVRAIEQKRRMAGHPLETARPVRARQPLRGRAKFDGQAGGLRLLQQAQGHDGVLALVRSGQRAHAVMGAARGLDVEPRPVRGQPYAFVRGDEPRPDRRRLGLDGGPGLGRQVADHGRPPSPQHARLLPRDGGERGAEEGLVVLFDADDGGSEGLGDIGGVEPAPHAHLEHGRVHARPSEVDEGGRGEHLEVRRMGGDRPGADQPRGGGAHAGHRALEGRAPDVAAADRDPLVHAHEVGRGVAPDGEAGGAQRGVEVGHHRSLAVGAGHQQHGEGSLGMAELGAQRPHRGQAELDPETDAAGQVRGGAGAAGGGPGRHRGEGAAILQ